MVTPDLRNIVQDLVNVLRFSADTNRTPLLYGSVDIARRQTKLSRLEISRLRAQSQRRSGRRVVSIRLLEVEDAPVVAEAEFVGETGTKNVGLAAHEVHGEVGIVLTAVTAAVEQWAQRQTVRLNLMQVAVAGIGLVFRAGVPVQTLVPLDNVVGVAEVNEVIVIELAVVRVRRWIQVKDVGCDSVDLVGAQHVLLPITCQRLGGVS